MTRNHMAVMGIVKTDTAAATLTVRQSFALLLRDAVTATATVCPR